VTTIKPITAAVSLLIAGAAFAQTATPVVTELQANQAARTAEGVKSDELTKGGGIAKLRAEHRARRTEMRMVQAEGAVPADERTTLAEDQKAAGGDIHKQKDHAQKRP
jgi:glutamate 5-kinase